MNYFDYINNIKPDKQLKNRTRTRVKFEISKQNSKRNNIKKALPSIAACFIILTASVFTLIASNQNSDYINHINESVSRNLFSEKIMVNITSDESEANPQKIIIGDNLYLQYQKKDSNETDNDEIEIYKSDIGKLLYIIDENNLVDQLKSSKNPNANNIQKNKFCNAEVYKLNNYKNNTVILVKEKDKEEYYLFYLISSDE